VIFTERVILGLDASTSLADANYDGKINMQDVTQLELIILGRESVLTFIDSADRIVTVNKPVKRVVILSPDEYQVLRVLGADDKIVGITAEVERDWDWLIGEEIPLVGTRYNPEPDLVIGEGCTIETKLEGKIPGPMVALGFASIEILDDELPKLGYILSKQDIVEDYFSNFHDKYVNMIKARITALPDDERPKVYVGWGTLGYGGYYDVYFGDAHAVKHLIETAGGKYLFEDLPGWGGEVDPEELITRGPDMAFYDIRYPNAGYAVDDISNAKAMREEIMDELAGVTAVENGSVYMQYGRI